MDDALTDDDRLIELLRAAIGPREEVPPEVTLAARSALAWRRMDADLAELLSDSAMEPAGAGSMRSTTAPRTLAFASGGGRTLEVEVSEHDGQRRLLGQVVPPVSARILVRHPGGVETITSDELGQFRVDGLPPGPMSLRCEPPDGPPVETGWVVV